MTALDVLMAPVAWTVAASLALLLAAAVHRLIATVRVLRAERRALDRVERLARLGSWRFDPERGEAWWSPETYRIFGRDPADGPLIGPAFLEHVHAADRERAGDHYVQMLDGVDHWELDYRFVVDGEVRAIHSVGRRDDDGRYVGTVQDLTVLRRAEQRFGDLLEAAPDAMVIADAGGAIVFVNRRAEELFCRPRDALLGEAVEVLLSDDAAAAYAARREALLDDPQRSSSREPVELTARRRDGSAFPVEVSLSLLSTEQGMLVSAAVRDITGRRRNAERLAHLAHIVECSQDAIVGKTLDGTVTTWNPGAERMYGYALEEMIGRPISTIFAEDTPPDELDVILRRVAAGEPVEQYEGRRRTRDGRTLDVSLTVSPLRDEHGRVIGASTITRDITERKRAAAALAEAERRFRSAFEHAPIGMALLDGERRLTEVNDAFSAIVGYERAHLAAMSLDAITHPDDIGAGSAALEEVLTGARLAHNAEQRFLHASGHPVHCDVHATALADAAGRATAVLVQVQDITDRRRHEAQLEYLADHDVLTGLLNRRAFNRALKDHAALAERYGRTGAVLVLDLDRFKEVNDTLGHHVGDELIVRVADVLAERVRTTDVLARLGGDEFGVLLPRANRSAALSVARELLERLRSERIQIGGATRCVSASVGVAAFEDEQDADAEAVLVNADLAMYDAKEDGRDRVAAYYSPEHAQARTKGRITWAHRITAALDQEGFTLMAQPIADLVTDRVARYELLLRMRDGHGDLIPPATFLYIAERLDLIQPIDRWVVSRATEALASLAPGTDAGIAINVSAASLKDGALLHHIGHEIARTGADPRRLVVEITETAALSSLGRARTFGEALAEIGCRLALDDFGAGYGSFSYLKHLHFDCIKIDGDFVRDCRASDVDRCLIRAIVDIARGLGKRTVAEFVGDGETLALLRELGIDEGQGYWLGMPAPLDEHLAAVGGVARSTRISPDGRRSAAR